MFWSSRGGWTLTSGGRCRCFWSSSRPSVGMFSHCMRTRGQQHDWLLRLAGVTWLSSRDQGGVVVVGEWVSGGPVGLSGDGHLNPILPRRVRATDLNRRRGGWYWPPLQTSGSSNAGRGWSPPPSLRDGVMVTVGHTRPRASCITWSLRGVIAYSLWSGFRSQLDVDIKYVMWEKTNHKK